MINFDEDDFDNFEDFKMTMMSYRGHVTISLIDEFTLIGNLWCSQ